MATTTSTSSSSSSTKSTSSSTRSTSSSSISTTLINQIRENVFFVGADTDGDIQAINVGKNDDSIPIYYELETQDIEFGNNSHLKKISDKIVVFNEDGLDSLLEAKVDNENYKPIPVDLNRRVNIGEDIDLEGKQFIFKWSGQSQNSSPVFEGLYLENVTDLGMVNK